MKALFEEYGFVLVTVIVIITLIMLVRSLAFGKIQGNLESWIQELSNAAVITNTTHHETPIGPDDPGGGGTQEEEEEEETKVVIEGDVTVGNIITLDGKNYRVIKSSATQATLLGMYDAGIMKYNTTSKTTLFDDYDGQKYGGSNIDNYLENTFYPSLSFKDAIVPKTITQTMFAYAALPIPGTWYKSWYKEGFTSSTSSGTPYYIIDQFTSVSVGQRHVYVLDLRDVLEYLEYDFTPQRVNKMFYDTNASIGKVSWLRSCSAEYEDVAFLADGIDGSVYDVDYGGIDCSNSVRPVFVIDLTKCEIKK